MLSHFMKIRKNALRNCTGRFLFKLLLVGLLAACGSQPPRAAAPPADANPTPASATASAPPIVTEVKTPSATGGLTSAATVAPPTAAFVAETAAATTANHPAGESIASASPSPSPVPPPLPTFTHPLIRPGVAPGAYLSDPCEYLRRRWSPEASEPGTVVAPIMFHGIRGEGKNLLEGDTMSVSAEDFKLFVNFAKNNGFVAITTHQLIGFLLRNERIPARALLMIVDDRRPGTIESHFLPELEANDWSVTLGWIIGDTKKSLWDWIERLYASGRLDVQSHGYAHNYITQYTSEADIRHELFDPIPVLEEHFGQRPEAFIWPGGNFTAPAVALAQEAGYTLGFTAFSRGPLMFNWIPLGEEEQAVQTPLLTLPRFWSTDLTVSLTTSIQIGEAARAAAEVNFPQEAAYYRQYCGGELKP